MDYPKFPSDFSISTLQKRKEENHPDKLEKKLVKKEIERIYQIVMDTENIVIDEDFKVDSVGFDLDQNLSLESRKYIMEQILENFPRIIYYEEEYGDKFLGYPQYKPVEINYVTDYVVEKDMEFIILLEDKL